MATTRTITWSTYYARQREDEGIIQNFFRTDLGMLAARTRLHLNNSMNFTDTITGPSFGNAILVPGNETDRPNEASPLRILLPDRRQVLYRLRLGEYERLFLLQDLGKDHRRRGNALGSCRSQSNHTANQLSDPRLHALHHDGGRFCGPPCGRKRNS